MRVNKQLFDRLHDVEFDELSMPLMFPKVTVRPQTSKSTMFSFRWPNGSPCLLMELYLQARSFEIVENIPETSSPNTIAPQLSHIVRFCWAIHKDFWELEQTDMEDFIYVLMQEKSDYSPIEPKRNNNTVEEIMSATFDFIFWLQNNIFLNVALIGTNEDKANIRLKNKLITDWRGNQKMVAKFPHLPPRATIRPKGPISREVKSRLWNAVSEMSDLKLISKRYLCKFDTQQRAAEELLYLKKRRELLLSLLEATGARPGELSLLKVSQNERCTKDNTIILRTLKKRGYSERKIPLDPSVAIKLEMFIQLTRKQLLSKLGVSASPQNYVFLTVMGTPLGVGSMTREFGRVASAAGLVDVQVCMSMFRHRFITTMVIIHLKAFMSETNGKLRATLNLADYRTILKRVAVFTGHSSVDSLMHYINMAWDEMRVFGYVEPTLYAVNKAEGVISELESIVSTGLLSQQIDQGKFSNEALLNALQRFLDEHRQVFENFKTYKTEALYPDGKGDLN